MKGIEEIKQQTGLPLERKVTGMSRLPTLGSGGGDNLTNAMNADLKQENEAL